MYRIVNGLEEARALLRDASAMEEATLHLISPPYAGCHAGVGYYSALVSALREEFPGKPFSFTLCCGDDPAIAHAALVMGFNPIVCMVEPAMRTKLHALAASISATVLEEYPA